MRGIIIGSLLGLAFIAIAVVYHMWLQGASVIAYVFGAVCMAIVTVLAMSALIVMCLPDRSGGYEGPDYE